MRGLAICAAVFGAGPVLAEPWQGVWAEDTKWCANAGTKRELVNTIYPLELTAEKLIAYESCDIGKVSEAGSNAWLLPVVCSFGEEVNRESLLVMVQGPNMWMWTGRGEPIWFRRCP